MMDSQVGVTGSRKLAYTDIGEPGWPCVFLFHGAPSSRLRVAYLEQQFLAERVRVVSPDRPSYGRSSPQPGRSMADWPSDVAALADALRIDRFMVAGHSSGGPYALACAALLPERVLASVTLGGVTDMGWVGAWDGYIESECELMRVADEEAAIAWCVERYGADGSGFMAASGFTLPEPDEKLTLLPLAHGRHTAELVPGSTFGVLPGHGHFTVLAELPPTVSTLWRSLL